MLALYSYYNQVYSDSEVYFAKLHNFSDLKSADDRLEVDLLHSADAAARQSAQRLSELDWLKRSLAWRERLQEDIIWTEERLATLQGKAGKEAGEPITSEARDLQRARRMMRQHQVGLYA
ncbi:unnamed protein product [Protopolystoma xenopodis]|uniref:Uncharacterized protein n=1 Tax=Protopolystoma xenopodis TaxID=117903 RepID=A0A448WW11_9PLAT|nr:unnamed protein product [Protopolystoma xenopodis]